MKSLLLLLLCFFISYGFDENNVSENTSFIDQTHADFSFQIKSWGARVDDVFLGIYDFFEDDNATQEVDINWMFQEGNTSYQKDTSLFWIKVNTTENNASKYTLDTNASDTFDFFALIKEKNITIAQAENTFFMYKVMDVDDLNSTMDKKTDEKEELVTPAKTNESNAQKEKTIDDFFLTRKLLEERNRSYIRASFLQPYSSLGPDDFRFTVKARVHLTRSRKRLKLFIEDFNDDSAKNIGKTDDENNPSIGLEQSSKEIFGIRPRYSVGFRGIDPFVRARYTFETDFGRWNFKPVQTFQYSLKDEFSETTEVFLDTPISPTTLLRFVVDRGTITDVPGMNYDGFIQWFYKPYTNAGLSFNLGANGSTKYLNTITEVPLLEKEENRVFNYLFLVRWRENIWKKWLFYEVGPGVNYHEQYDYRPNYTIFFGLDMFFGHI